MEPGLVQRARQHPDRTAILAEGARFSYRDLLRESGRAAGRLLRGAGDLGEKRVAFLLPPGFSHVATQWGIWRAGGIAVPLCTSHPPPEWEYVIRDCGAHLVVVHKSLAERIRPVARRCEVAVMDDASAEPDSASVRLPSVPPSRRAMIVYTSGTTSRPKGVVSTHGNLEAQIETLVRAWGWQPQDHILHVLPLHHVHGIVNVLCCALWSGATCEMLPGFQAGEVWERFAGSPLTLFMAVPTVYSMLITAWEASPASQREAWSQACSRMRLMVSGSAALPVQVLEKWQQISGHRLLERYGMTEIGMALSNPLEGERRAGYVGTPLPGVEVRLVDDQGEPVQTGVPGEIQVKGPGVFEQYWRRSEESRSAFTDGWFRTGDVAVVEKGCYRVLGRKSVDIIKTGGYKVSALEIEEALRTHPDIAECAVVGLPDREWGECVAAALVLRPGRDLSADGLRDWAKARLAVYKVPRRFMQMDSLPRNSMGKVNKRELAKHFPSG
ncbi:MAG: acyl-CoA synthetase [Acidobacteria bacterium]|nr:acyl-CoA synthetase [Acidobacteriota bacterium]